MAEFVYSDGGVAGAARERWHRVKGASQAALAAWRDRVPTKELVIVTAQLSLMLETGNTISESLAALSRQIEGAKMGAVLDEVSSSVAGGRTLTASLEEHPSVFPPLFVSSVRAGETSGRLAEIFKRLELHMKKRMQLRESIRSALTYPAILSVLLVAVVIFAVTFVLPRFTSIFDGAGVVLPLPTRLLMGTAALARRYWYLIPVGLGGLAFGIFAIARNSRCRVLVDEILLRTPVVGPLLRSISTSSLVRTLGMLLESGVPLMETIEVAKSSVNSYSFRRFTEEIERSVLHGEGFSSPFRDSGLMGPVDQQMAETGEKTSTLATVMTRLADHHDGQVEVKLKRLTAVMEPMFIAVMGAFVGFVAMAVLLPLFRMASALRVGG